MELDYDYIAKLVRKTQEGDSDAFAELNYILLLISRSTVLPINM